MHYSQIKILDIEILLRGLYGEDKEKAKEIS